MLKILIKLRLKEISSSITKRNKKSTKTVSTVGIIGFILATFMIMNLLWQMFEIICRPYSALGFNHIYFAFAGILGFILSFIGSVFLAKTEIFEAKDNEVLFAMPIKTKYIFTSRLLSLIIFDAIYALMVIIPVGGVYFVTNGFSFRILISLILMAVSLTLMAITIALIIGGFVAWISSKFGKKNLVSMIIMVVLFLAYMSIAVMWRPLMMRMAENGTRMEEVFETFFFPFYHLGKSVAYLDIKSVAISLAITLLPFYVTAKILDKNFIKIAMSERGAKKRVYKEKRYRKVSKFWSIVICELNRLKSSTLYMMNSGISLAIMIAMLGYILFKSEYVNEFIASIAGVQSMPFMLCSIIMLNSAMVTMSGVVISLDAKTLWISKVIPMRADKILLAKSAVHGVVSLPFVLIAVVIVQFTIDADVLIRTFILLISVATVFFHMMLGIVINLTFPKFNWTTEAVAIKNSLSPMLTIVLGIAISGGFALIYFFTGIAYKISASSWMSIVLAAYIMLTAILYLTLKTKADKIFYELNED